jgi:hypothetical protein
MKDVIYCLSSVQPVQKNIMAVAVKNVMKYHYFLKSSKGNCGKEQIKDSIFLTRQRPG